MNCQIFETVVNDLARARMIEANVREQALAHSGDCEACALRLALERRLTFGLRALAAEMKSVSASAAVEQHVREAFRSQTMPFSRTRAASRWRYWGAAAAAVFLIAFAIAGMWSRLEEPSQHSIEAINNSEEQTSPLAATVVTEHPKSKSTPKQTAAFYPPRRKESARRLAKRASIRNETSVTTETEVETDSTVAGDPEQREVTTRFLSLSYVSPVNLQDGGELVRVELPRSAMARFGLPVNIERYGERVKADVLVSADGLARAIRFVQ
ncbi:MAG: hypothetical protein ABR568_20640 [Pyrinomonadaceae bacterium]